MVDSTDLHIYGNVLSQPSRSVYALIKMANIAHTTHEINMLTKEHKSEDYLKINAKGAIPAIKDGDFCLSESAAILKYLATTRNVSETLYPKDIKKRAHVDAFLEWN